MKRLVPAMMMLALCSCGDGGSSPADGGVKAAQPSKSGPRPSAQVQRDRQVMGRWRSAAGILPGSRNQWIILDIAGTKDVRMEVRSSDLGREAVTAFATGKAVVTMSGADVTLADATGPLEDFRQAAITMQNSSMMHLTAQNGRQLDLTYDGQ